MRTEFATGRPKTKDDRRNQRYYRSVVGIIKFFPEEEDPFDPETIVEEVSGRDLKEVVKDNVPLLYEGLEIPFESDEGTSYRDGLDRYAQTEGSLLSYTSVFTAGPVEDSWNSTLSYHDDEYHVNVEVCWNVPAEVPSGILDEEICLEGANLDRLEEKLEQALYESVRENYRASKASEVADQANRLIRWFQNGVGDVSEIRDEEDEEEFGDQMDEVESIQDEIDDLNRRIRELKQQKARRVERLAVEMIQSSREEMLEEGWSEQAIDAALEYIDEEGLSTASLGGLMHPQSNGEKVMPDDVIDDIDLDR